MRNTTFSVNPLNHSRANFVVCCALCVLPFTAHAGSQTVPLQIIQMSALSFSTFTIERGGGSVAVDAKTGACQPKSAVMVRNLCEQGKIEIRGQPEAQLLVEILPQGISGSGAVLRNMNIYPSNNGIITLGLDGKAMVSIGGELAVSDASAPEISAAYMLNINYLY